MRKVIAALGAVLLLGGVGERAAAAPVLGDQLFYSGGSVTVTSQPASSGFTSELGLYDGSFNLLLFLMLDEPSGTVASFNPGNDFGFAVGDELIFGIRVVETDQKYFMGPGSRNPDDFIHNTVDNVGGGDFIVGFEDILGGGDQDYNDNVFKFEGGVTTTVPEPSSLALLGLGLLGFLLARRKLG